MVYVMRDIFGSNTQQITINIDIKYITGCNYTLWLNIGYKCISEINLFVIVENNLDEYPFFYSNKKFLVLLGINKNL